MVLGLSRRPKREADWIMANQHSFRFPLGNPLERLYKTDLTDNPNFNPLATLTPLFSIMHFAFNIDKNLGILG